MNRIRKPSVADFDAYRQEYASEILKTKLIAAGLPDMYFGIVSEKGFDKTVRNALYDLLVKGVFDDPSPSSRLLHHRTSVNAHAYPLIARVLVHCGYSVQYVKPMRLLNSIQGEETAYGYTIDVHRAYDSDFLIIDYLYSTDFVNALSAREHMIYLEFIADYIQDGGCIITGTDTENFEEFPYVLKRIIATHFTHIEV